MDIRNNQWMDTPIEGLQALGEESSCFMRNSVIVSSSDEMIGPADVIAVFNWDPDTEQFILE